MRYEDRVDFSLEAGRWKMEGCWTKMSCVVYAWLVVNRRIRLLKNKNENENRN